MGYAVLHHEKGKGSGGGLGNHVDRKKGAEHSYRQADPERRELNKSFDVPRGRQNMSIPEAINDRIKEGYNGKRKIRTDAVKFVKTVLTGSHQEMKDIFKDEDKAKDWIDANRKFIEDEFGKENLVRFTLHMDEKTPHIHAVTVPITEDGRLSAKETMGNKDKLQARQDRYAVAMKPFGLERGVRSTGIRHENAREYYARMKSSLEDEKSEISVSKRFLGVKVGIDKDKTIEALEDEIKKLKTQKISAIEKSKADEKKKMIAMKEAEKSKQVLNNAINNPEKVKEVYLKRLENTKLRLSENVKNKLQYIFTLDEMSPEELHKYTKNDIFKITKEMNLNNNLVKDVAKDKEFVHELYQQYRDKAEENRNFGRGRGGISR